MNKLCILVAIAVNLSLISGQLVARRAVHGGAWGGRGWGGAWGGRAAYATPALVGGYGLGGLGGYGGLGANVWGTHLGGHYGGYGLAAPAAIGLAHTGYAGYGGYAGHGLGLGLGLRGAVVGHAQHVGPVSAAIETRRHIQVVDVPTSQDVIQPATLIVEPNVLPVNIEFRSQSSPVNVNQVHIPGRPGQVQHTSSEEEADRLTHEVVKPVIQEVRETIVPFRRITQEVLPVQEEVQSLVARGQRQQVLAAPQVVAAPQAVGVAVAQPVAARVASGLIAVPTGGLIGGGALGGLGLVNGGLVNGGLINGGLVSRGLIGGGLVNGGLINGGLVNGGGLVTTGISRFGGAIGGLGLGGVVPIRAARS